MFICFAIVAIAWGLLALRAGFSRQRSARLMITASIVVVVIAGASIALDIRAMNLARSAQPSDLSIHIEREGGWWRIQYRTVRISVTTANELHVPTGTAVALSWSGVPPPWFDGAVCPPRYEEQCTLVAGDGATARFVRLWRPMWQRLPVVAEPRPQFERWLRNEAQPARPSGGAALFVSAGCGFCHEIRGVVRAEAPESAPDLTHFAARRTIAATGLPNRRGFIDGWIVHSRGLKRGSAMPDNRLDPPVLRGVIAYLESLR